MKKKQIKINKEMVISEVLTRNADLAEVFISYGLHCVGCPISQSETIENGAKAHGLPDTQIDELITRLNEVAQYDE